MEQEFKWTADRAAYDRLCAALSCRAETTTEMRATYYDTPDRTLRARKIGLRLRQENGVSVCCMKKRGGERTADGLHAHAEYECPASSIEEGLSTLPAQGADPVLCAELAHAGLIPICRTSFRRLARLADGGAFTAELAFDQGTLASGGRETPFSEIELELKSGDAAAFRAFGESLARMHGLMPQPLSKLARALQLSETENHDV